MKRGMPELEQTLEALGAKAECVGASGFPTKEDVLLTTASSAALWTVQQVKGARLDGGTRGDDGGGNKEECWVGSAPFALTHSATK